jgi:hypothetical protein
MIVFQKVKKINLLLNLLYGFAEIKNNLSIIKCAIKFYINAINILFVYL